MIYSCVASHSSIAYLYKGDPASVYGVPIIMDLTNTASEQSLQQAQIWLQDCSINHNCRQALWLPDTEFVRNSRTCQSPRSGDASSQVTSSEQNIEPGAKIQKDKALVKWYKRPTSLSKSKKNPSVTKKRDDGDNLEGCASLKAGEGLEGLVRLSSSRSQKPKRLIHLKAFGERSLDARLVEEYGLKSKYATLSYCWGMHSQHNFTTTSQTLTSRLSCIQYSIMPATFQHAFEIARALGIRYIWIDSLCIIQDSPSDWEEESTKMGAIYSNSYITIAADWSTSAIGGCYNMASDTVLEGNKDLIRITSILSDNSKSSLYIGWAYRRRLPEIEESILTTRAWAYQERVLSPRMLHFTKKQVFWECRKTVLAEDMIPVKLPKIHQGGASDVGHGYPLPGLIQQLDKSGFEKPNHSPLQLWYHTLISGSYAKRNIGVSLDKLPAISALARLWSQYIPGPYLAGLWYHDLVMGLCWRRTGSNIVKPVKYRCPSWSWASLECDVYWSAVANHVNDVTMVLVESTNIMLAGKDPFGRVSGGLLRINGHVGKFYVENEYLRSSNGELVGDAFIDTYESPGPVEGLLLLVSGGKTAYVLLLSTTSSTSSGVIGLERKGLARISRGLGDPSVLEYFEEIETRTVTLI